MIDFMEPNKWKEECGVFGVYSHEENVSEMTYLGLYALQHRGQESAGIAITDGAWMDVTRGMGLVNEVFHRACTLFNDRVEPAGEHPAAHSQLCRRQDQPGP